MIFYYFVSILRFMSDEDRVSMVPRPRLDGFKTKTKTLRFQGPDQDL